jgi:hypothetical protein
MVMEKHPDVNARDDEGMTPIHLSVQRDALRGKTYLNMCQGAYWKC